MSIKRQTHSFATHRRDIDSEIKLDTMVLHTFMPIDEALSKTHGSKVHLMAVVASIGSVTARNWMDPYVTREICIRDVRLGFLTITMFGFSSLYTCTY